MGCFEGNVIFATIYLAIPILAPVLPDIPKILDAIIIYILIFIMYIVVDKARWGHRKKAFEKYSLKWLILPSGILAVLLLFGFGAFKYIPVVVATNSMRDVFARGSLIVVEKINEVNDIQVGEIIEFEYNSVSVVHRVVDISYSSDGSRQFITKGDNNPTIDLYPVKSAQVVGRARWYIPYIGYPALIFTDLSGAVDRNGALY